MAERIIVEDATELARAACERVMACVRGSVAARGRCVIALSGGSTPRALYQELARHPELPWGRVHLCFGDERAVPPDDPRSNARMVHESDRVFTSLMNDWLTLTAAHSLGNNRNTLFPSPYARTSLN